MRSFKIQKFHLAVWLPLLPLTCILLVCAMDFASNLTIDQTFTNICFPNCCLQGSCFISLSFRGQGATILSLSAFHVQKEKAAVSLPFVSSFFPQGPLLACQILLHVSISPSPCEASCVLGLLPTGPCELFQAYSWHFHPFLWRIISHLHIPCLALG